MRATGEDDGRTARVDHVDELIAQWRRERPDVDVSPMAVVARISRLSRILDRKVDEMYARYGLNQSQFGVLAALRRTGPPYCLSPTDLYNALLITSGAMTNRLERLASAGYIERIPDPTDGRSMLVALTSEGRRLVDRMLRPHTRTRTGCSRHFRQRSASSSRASCAGSYLNSRTTTRRRARGDPAATRLGQAPAAVDAQILARHVAGDRRREIDDGAHDVARLADTAERRAVEHVGAVALVIEPGGVEVGADVSWGDRVHAYAGSPVNGECPCQLD